MFFLTFARKNFSRAEELKGKLILFNHVPTLTTKMEG
jgi:hypothetical protein